MDRRRCASPKDSTTAVAAFKLRPLCLTAAPSTVLVTTLVTILVLFVGGGGLRRRRMNEVQPRLVRPLAGGGGGQRLLPMAAVCPPELKVSTPAHTKHLGGYV